jgi:uncharacterized membrane protein YhhN
MGVIIKRTFLVIFILALAGYLAGILLEHAGLQRILKPLLMPPLAGYFMAGTASVRSPLKAFVLLALFFSWAGDILLQYQDRDELFFLAGLSAFLFAHIFYIIFFHRIRVRRGIPGNPWFIVLVAAYYIALMAWLSPYLDNLQMAVRMYGIFISFMLVLALHVGLSKKVPAGKVMLAGAVFFVLSDTLLAVNKFYSAFSFADFLVIATYACAQFLIVYGAIAFLWQTNTR